MFDSLQHGESVLLIRRQSKQGASRGLVIKAMPRDAGASLNRKLARAHPVDIRNAARSHPDGAAREAS
jgi:hypothetical protein